MAKKFIILAFICVVKTTFASQAILPHQENIKNAQLICAVKVLTQKTESKNSTIMTHSTVKPILCFKGSVSTDLEIEWAGGVLGEKRTVIAGAPKLKVDDAAILYLTREKDSEPYIITNWAQGVIPLEKAPNSDEYQVPKKYVKGLKLEGQRLEDYATFLARLSSK